MPKKKIKELPLEELCKKVDDWFDDVMVNRFHFNGDITKEKDIKKFLKTKKIRIYVVFEGPNKEIERYCIEHKHKLKYVGVLNKKDFTFSEEDVNDIQNKNKV